MNRAPDSDISGVDRLSLETTPQASMIIDIDAARIVDANSAAAQLLTGRRLLPDEGLALDPGTPALAAIERHLARHSGAASASCDLLFWIETGTVQFTATCVPMGTSGSGRRRLVRVTAVDRPDDTHRRSAAAPGQSRDGDAAFEAPEDSALAIVQRARAAAMQNAEGSSAAARAARGEGSSATAFVPRDDATTLREIARRIRLGTAPQQPVDMVELNTEAPGFDPAIGAPAAVEIVQAAATREPAGEAEPATQLDGRPDETVEMADDGEVPVGIADTEGAHDTVDAAAQGATEAAPETAPPVTTVRIGQSGEIELAKLAHELRTPLAAIIALAEIMRDERLGAMGNSRYRGYAADIYDSAQHAISLLTATVDQIGSPMGEMRLEIEDVDANALIASCVSAMRPLADRAGIKLSASLAARLPRIRADERSMKQVLLNLLSNALRHTATGGEISVGSAHRLAGEVQIVVRDNGCGMEESEIDRALSGSGEPPPRRSPSGSTGFGLPLVRQLVVSNGARLAIESVQGTGTRVSVTFGADRTVPV